MNTNNLRGWIVKSNSLMQAIIFMVPMLNSILSILLKKDEGVMIFPLSILVLIYAITVLLQDRHVFTFKAMTFILFISIAYLLTIMTSKSLLSPVHFIYYCVFAFIITTRKADVKKTLEYMMYLSLFSLTVINTIFLNTRVGGYEAISMGLSYAFLPSILATILHFVYYRKKTNILIKVAYIVNVYILIMTLSMGTRGVILSLVCFVMVLLLNQFDKEGNAIVKSSSYYTRIVLLTILVGITAIFFDQILIYLYRIAQNNGLNIAFVEKILLTSSRGDVTNGRIPLMLGGINGFLNSPIFGNGIGTFAYKSGLDTIYPHNFIIQFLYEGGVLLAIPLVYITFSGISKLLAGKIKNLDTFIFMTILVVSTIPRLSVSGDVWRTPSFWMLMAYTLFYVNSKEKKN